MQKIVPHLWYDKEAEEAVRLYVDLFDNAKLTYSTIVPDTPSGDAQSVVFTLSGQDFMAISAGPFFKFNPSISLMVRCESQKEVKDKWDVLSLKGEVLMPLGEYPFNPYYGWVQDRYGLSWQLMLGDETGTTQKITPNLLFSGSANGKAEEAINFYVEVFEDSKAGFISRYKQGEAQSEKARINYADFTLRGMNFSAMDNGYDVDYTFSEAFSLIVYCKDQTEIDFYWYKLSAVPQAEQCGWLKDKFGVSWQIIPYELDEMMMDASQEKVKRVTKAFLEMKKLDLQALRNAFAGTVG